MAVKEVYLGAQVQTGTMVDRVALPLRRIFPIGVDAELLTLASEWSTSTR